MSVIVVPQIFGEKMFAIIHLLQIHWQIAMISLKQLIQHWHPQQKE
jgi:hypothetical protein